MPMRETDNDDETFNINDYNTDESLKISMKDPRDYPHGDLYLPEKEAYNKLQEVQSMEEPSADCTWLLFHRGASDIARRFYRLSDPIGVDDIFKENVLELSGTGEPECIFCECESECALKDESEAYVLEGEAFDELNVADADFAEEVIQIALDSGAGEHVANRNIAPSYSIAESPGSRAGQHFVAAGGARIPNEGHFKLRLRSGGRARGEGKDIESTFQVAKVTRPLWSVGRICDEGFSVNFTQTEAVVIDKAGQGICKFHRKGGLYVTDLHLKNPIDKAQDFLRRGK